MTDRTSNNLNVSDVQSKNKNADMVDHKRQLRCWKTIFNTHLPEIKKHAPDIADYVKALEDARKYDELVEEMCDRYPKFKPLAENMIEEFEVMLKILRERPIIPKKKPKGHAQNSSGEQDTEDNVQYKTHFEHAGLIYEQVYDGGISKFIEYDPQKGSYKEVNQLLTGDCAIRPVTGEALDKGVIKMAQRPEQYKSVEALRKEIQDIIHAYCDVDDQTELIASYYPLLAHVFDKMKSLMYLNARGDIGTGKTRFMMVVGMMCRNPMTSSGLITAAGLFRDVEEWKPTLLLNEFDMKESATHNELIKILNCGYEQGTFVSRCDEREGYKRKFYDVYCPKLMTTREQFQDTGLESRMLTHISETSEREDIPEDLEDEFYAKAQSIRNKLLLFRLQNMDKISPYPGIKKLKIRPRLRQISGCLFKLHAVAPDVIEPAIKYFEDYDKQLTEDMMYSPDGVMLGAAVALIETYGHELTATKIADKINFDDKQCRISPQKVGRMWKNLKLESDTIQTDNGSERRLRTNKINYVKIARSYGHYSNYDTLKDAVDAVLDRT